MAEVSTTVSSVPGGGPLPAAAAAHTAAVLGHQFVRRALVADATGIAAVQTELADMGAEVVPAVEPNAGFGSLLAHVTKRSRLADKVQAVLASGKAGKQLQNSLTAWMASKDEADACTKALEYADQWLVREGAFDADIRALHAAAALLPKRSLWLIMADGWGAGSDLAAIHHVLSSGEDINVLVLASDPASEGGSAASGNTPPRRDIGLYAMNYGGAYVASVSPAHSPGQYKTALAEADAFHGPALVLAYIPLGREGEADAAVASGRWPLYRWNPAKEAAGQEAFSVDSAKLRDDITEFLNRESHLTLLSRAEPQFAPVLTSSLESEVKERQTAADARLKASFDRLMGVVTPPPLAIVYGSDGGNAEGLSKRLAAEAKRRGFTAVSCKSMDAWSVADIAAAPLVVFIVSTAGQGEFPMNAREFWKRLSSTAPGSVDFSALHYAVFGLGDSNYWPRKEQRVFYNKPSLDLSAKLPALGATPLLEQGLGDDAETGGFQAGFRAWAPGLWAALGVGTPADADADAAAAKIRGDEDIKSTSNFLRGTILQGLSDDSTGALCYEDTKLTKFHGIYQQDDRDLRGDRKRMGLEPAYSFMVRVRIPGGVCTPGQYLALDAIADTHANGTIRVTTRQAVQFHGIIKKVLKPSIAAINRALMDTLAACGDVNRNVMCNANPDEGGVHAVILDFTRRLSDHLSPRTTAYHEIWLDDKLVRGGSVDVEPIYGKHYLPRKFKIAVAVPPSNDVDVFAHDLGFVAILSPAGDLEGFTVTVGGGMGMTHNNVKTYPRLGEPLCFATIEQALEVAEAVVTAQRDYGDRANRKHARLKYTIDDHGMEWFKGEVQSRVKFSLAEPRPFTFHHNSDRYGWVPAGDGTFNYTMFIQNGRIKDFSPDYRLKSGLRAIAAQHEGDIRFTPNQNVIIARVSQAARPKVEALMTEYGIENRRNTGLRLNSMACVAMPTCALALAESERYLPSLLTRIEMAIEESGLHDDAITVRMTGCPNGCARPYIAEIGFVGRSPGIYNMYLGAGHAGERLSKIYKESVDEETIVTDISLMLKRYAKERNTGEFFGDWVIRAGIVKATLSGRTFHDV